MAKNLPAIRAIIRQFLKDEFKVGVDLVWEDDELDLHIADCLTEISESCPYELRETLTTTAGSKELDISSIEDLIELDLKHPIEFRVGQDPPDYRNCSIFGGILRMDIDFSPAAGESVYLYCHKPHQLTVSSSTLTPQLERLLVLGAAARAAIAKAGSRIDKINFGARTASDLQRWGESKLALYRAGLKQTAEPRTSQEYPKS